MRFLNRLIAVSVAGLILTLIAGGPAWAESTNTVAAAENPEAAAWKNVQQSAQLPKPAPEWQTQPPTAQQEESFYQQVAAAATLAADKARAFYLQFPHSTNAIAARKLECTMWDQAFSLTGDTNVLSAWAAAQESLLADPELTGDDRFDLRVAIVRQKEMTARTRTPGELTAKWNASQAERERGIRALIQDYPDKEKPYQLLISFGANSPDEKARSIANEILTLPVSEPLKTDARGILRRLDAPGKPLDIKFTALDGREVDLTHIQGKVVLVDFWATWCGPCVGELPRVKETYQKFHAQGFEIVGISFDGDKTALEHFVKSKDLPWPQYFDGHAWKNQFGVQYCIHSIPTMWLVDKKGNLRETNAREDLQEKVAKLLAE
jgi:thiol-disulfide isomerase/thioredoxin